MRLTMVAAGAVAALACQSMPADAQTEVLNFSNWNYVEGPAPFLMVDGQKRSIDILGFSVRMTGSSALAHAESFFKNNDYVLRTNTRKIECTGNTMIGTSSPYMSEIQGRKRNNDFTEEVNISLATPIHGNQITFLKREIVYNNQDTRPSYQTVVKSLIDKYGPTNLQASIMEWRTEGAHLIVRLYGVPEGALSTMNMELRGTDGKRPSDEMFFVLARKQVCDKVRAIEKQRIDEINAKGTNAPKL